MFNPESFPQRNEPSHEENWKWKEFSFEKGTLYLAPEVKKLSREDQEELLEDVRKFQKEAPEILHSGSDGSVYILQSGKYLLKEQLSKGKELLKRRAKLQKTIERDASFPNNVHLIDYIAAVDPPYRKDEYGRKIGPETFQEHKTQVAVGDGAWTREANISGYVVMPFVGEGIDLGDLYRYFPETEDEDLKQFVQKMLEKGIISDASEVASFAKSHGNRIEKALLQALQMSGQENDGLRDFAYRNILLDIEGENPQFYIIDL